MADGAITVSDEDKTLSFTSAKATKNVNVTYLGDNANLSASANEEFVTVAIRGGVLSVTCAANSGTARTATVTVTDGVNSVEIAISQAA